VGGSPGESHCAPPIHRLSRTPSAAPRAGVDRVAAKAVCPPRCFPPPVTGIALPGVSPWEGSDGARFCSDGENLSRFEPSRREPCGGSRRKTLPCALGRIRRRQFRLTGLSSLRSAREFEARRRRNIASLRFVIAPWAARYRAHSLRLAQAAARQQTQKETQQQPPSAAAARR